MTTKRTLAIWLPEWPLQHRFRKRPELEGRPVALYAAGVHSDWRIAAASPKASAAGVRAGMPLAEACALVGHGNLAAAHPECRDADSPVFEIHDPVHDLDRLRRLAHWCERFSPLVAMENADEPQTLLLNVVGCGPAFGGEERLVRQAWRSMQKLGLSARLALADTPAAAWAISRYGRLRLPKNAKASAATDVPTGWTVVEEGATAAAVRDLPVESLRPSSATLPLLAEMGLDTVGQIADLPPTTLLSRFGDEFVDRLHQVMGRHAETLQAEPSPPPVAVHWSFETSVANAEVLERVRGELVEQLCGSLPRGRGVVKLLCWIELDSGPPMTLVVDLARPSADPDRIDELLGLRWERLELPSPVASLRLTAAAVERIVVRQIGLFDAETGEADAADLWERLSNRLGRDRVVRPLARPDPQPEFAASYVPLVGERANHPAGSWLPAPASYLRGPRPLRLRPRPLAVSIESKEGMPILVHVEDRSHRIWKAVGPERLETAWWRGPSVRRDYYRVEIDDGRRWWLFRRLDDDRWFLHGEFD